MRAVLSVIAALLAVSGAADAQLSQRRCEACAKAGLTLYGWRIFAGPEYETVRRFSRDVVVDSGFEGRIYFYFRNIGQIDWRIERVNCEFFTADNSRLFDHSFDLQMFDVHGKTPNPIRSAPYGMHRVVQNMKANCWIENAVIR